MICSDFHTTDSKEKELRRIHPTAFVALLRAYGRDEEVSNLYDGTYLTYSWHIVLTLLPSLAKQRKEGKLSYVKEKQIRADNRDALYTGEVNADGEPHGYGFAEAIDPSDFIKIGLKITSTWVDGKMEGLTVHDYPSKHTKFTYETKCDEFFGKGTIYLGAICIN